MERRQLSPPLKKSDIAKRKSADQPEFAEGNPGRGREVNQGRNHQAANSHPFGGQKPSPLNPRIEGTEGNKKTDHDLGLTKIENRSGRRQTKCGERNDR